MIGIREMRYGIGVVVVMVLLAGGAGAVLAEESNKTVNLTYISNYNMPNIWDIKVSGNYAYVTNGSNFSVINVSNPQSPKLVSNINNLGSYIAISGNYAYVSGSNLSIINITDPAHPTIVGNYNNIGGSAIIISGDYAYVAKYRDSLLVFDISNKTNPRLIGSTYVYQIGLNYDIAAYGNYVYTTDCGVLKVINVSNHAFPAIVKNYTLSGCPSSIAFSNNYVSHIQEVAKTNS